MANTRSVSSTKPIHGPHSTSTVLFALTPALLILAISPIASINRFAGFKLAGIGVAFIVGLIFWLVGRDSRKLSVFQVLLILQALTFLFVFLAHPSNQLRQIFGSSSRGVGLLSLSILTATSLFASKGLSYSLTSKFIKSLYISGLVVSTYALLQYFNFDLINWSSDKKWIFSTLGNPNHLAAFLAIHILVSIFLQIEEKRPFFRIAGLVVIFLDFFLIYVSRSAQGFFILTLGALLALFLTGFVRASFTTMLLCIGSFFTSVTLFAMGGLGYGPLMSFFQEGTLLRRVELFEAALRMIDKSPLIGHGFNSYEWLFPSTRSTQSVDRVGTDRLADSSHNQLLDFAVSGGLLLAISLLSVWVVTAFLGVRNLKQLSITGEQKMLKIQITLILIWISTVAHNLVSPPSLAISYLGAFSAGLVVSSHRKSKTSSKVNKVSLAKAWPFAALIPLVFLATSYPYVVDTSLVSAVKARKTERAISLAKAFPPDEDRILITSSFLAQVGRREDAISLVDSNLDKFPKSIRLRSFLVRLTTEVDRREELLLELKALDPYRY